MEESCNIYVHFMRKKLYVQITRWLYAMQNLRNFTDWLSMIERIKFTDRMSMIERIKFMNEYESYEYEFPTHMNEFVRLYESTKCPSVSHFLFINESCLYHD